MNKILCEHSNHSMKYWTSAALHKIVKPLLGLRQLSCWKSSQIKSVHTGGVLFRAEVSILWKRGLTGVMKGSSLPWEKKIVQCMERSSYCVICWTLVELEINTYKKPSAEKATPLSEFDTKNK